MSTPLPKPQMPGSRSWWPIAPSSHKTTNTPHKTASRPIHHAAPHREVPHYTKTKRWTSRTSVLWVLVIVVLWVTLWANKYTILSQLQSRWLRDNGITDTNVSETLFVGQDANLSGTITNNNASTKYTQTLQTTTYGTVWLRSSTIPLQQYSNDVQIMGKVIDYEWSMYIIDVTDITSLSVVANTGSLVAGKEYIASAGIIISDLASDNLTRDQGDTSTSQWLFTISDMTTNNKVIIRYITCDKTNPARDCASFSQKFDAAQRADFVDSYANTFYKLADAKTWFASIDDTIGIYLESEDATMIPRVMRHLQFINNERAKKTFLTTAKEICINPDTTINTPTSFTIVPYEDTFAVRVEWTSIKGWSLVCMIMIDPSNSLGGTLMNINPLNGDMAWTDTGNDTTIPTVVGETTPTVVINNNGWGMTAPSVKQFPLKPGKELTFKSRGKEILFPSSNISFSSFNTSEKIGWLSCSMGTKVIVYADKANLETNPAIILYSCKTGTPTLSDTMISFDAEGMTYIVDIKDPSWYEFATHIVVKNTVL